MAKKYYIHAEYQTGDSFGHEDTDTNLAYEWDNLAIAKENLQRIKDHYKYYLSMQGGHYGSAEDRKAKELIQEEAKKQPWYVEEYEFCLMLKSDEGKEFQYSAPWCGYFESLYTARIKTLQAEDDDMCVDFRD